jgi:hypothetical protein
MQSQARPVPSAYALALYLLTAKVTSALRRAARLLRSGWFASAD